VLEPGTKFIPGIHVDAVCQHLQALIEDRIKDLIINIPPGFAKSMISAVFFPAWVWIKRPEYRFLFSSYKAEYATRDSVKCRSLIQSNWYQERWGDRFKLKSAPFELGGIAKSLSPEPEHPTCEVRQPCCDGSGLRLAPKRRGSGGPTASAADRGESVRVRGS
jgi:hypothetical protein